VELGNLEDNDPFFARMIDANEECSADNFPRACASTCNSTRHALDSLSFCSPSPFDLDSKPLMSEVMEFTLSRGYVIPPHAVTPQYVLQLRPRRWC
jgi:hypothetical protein